MIEIQSQQQLTIRRGDRKMSKAIWRRIIIIFIFCIGFLISIYFIMNETREPNIEIKKQ